MISLFLADLLAREHVADMLREAQRERLRRAALGTGTGDAGDRRPSIPPTRGTESKPGPTPGNEAKSGPSPRWRFRPIG